MSMPLTILLQSIYFTLAFAAPALMGSYFTGTPGWANVLCLFVAAVPCFAASAYLGKKRLRLGLPVLLAVIAACVLLNGLQWATLMPAIAILLLGILALRQTYGKGSRLIEHSIIIIGLVLYAFAYGICYFNIYWDLCDTLSWLCLVLLGLTLLFVNRMTVRDASGGQARRMMGGNQLLTLGFVGVLVAIVSFSSIRKAIASAIQAFIFWLLNLFVSTDSGVQQGGGEAMEEMDMSMLGEAKMMPEWLRVLSDIVLYTVTIAFCLVLICLFSVALYKACKSLYKKFRQWFKDFQTDNGPSDYVEETEQLLSGKSMADQFREDVKKRLKRMFTRPVSWDKLDPKQKVRRLYADILRELSTYVPTARAMSPERLMQAAEKESANFAPLYNAVRYGDMDVGSEEAETARLKLKKAK